MKNTKEETLLTLEMLEERFHSDMDSDESIKPLDYGEAEEEPGFEGGESEDSSSSGAESDGCTKEEEQPSIVERQEAHPIGLIEESELGEVAELKASESDLSSQPNKQRVMEEILRRYRTKDAKKVMEERKKGTLSVKELIELRTNKSSYGNIKDYIYDLKFKNTK